MAPVLIDDAQIRQALRNLMRNAAEALQERRGGAEVNVSTSFNDTTVIASRWLTTGLEAPTS